MAFLSYLHPVQTPSVDIICCLFCKIQYYSAADLIRAHLKLFMHPQDGEGFKFFCVSLRLIFFLKDFRHNQPKQKHTSQPVKEGHKSQAIIIAGGLIPRHGFY